MKCNFITGVWPGALPQRGLGAKPLSGGATNVRILFYDLFKIQHKIDQMD